MNDDIFGETFPFMGVPKKMFSDWNTRSLLAASNHLTFSIPKLNIEENEGVGEGRKQGRTKLENLKLSG